MREFVIGPYTEQPPSVKANLYRLYRRKADDWAAEHGREVAEGPTVLIRNNFYGPVELWPLVYIGGD